MSSKLIKRITGNYNDENLKSLDYHIEKQSQKTEKPVYAMVVEHKGTTTVTVTEKSIKKLSKVVLDL